MYFYIYFFSFKQQQQQQQNNGNKKNRFCVFGLYLCTCVRMGAIFMLEFFTYCCITSTLLLSAQQQQQLQQVCQISWLDRQVVRSLGFTLLFFQISKSQIDRQFCTDQQFLRKNYFLFSVK
eukprot:TRINITY_DN7888_c0_g1_i1.p3 TRINITY_DN7888_c0_g1~~TRINITY_DN7888_c0_g1_i1.p3  ORF type:complete len:121 (+),score=6.52 TRINITY_DN7888_c0_g1_i1:189-551(+)